MNRRTPPTTWLGQVRVTEEGTPLCRGCGQHPACCVCTLSCPPGRPPVLLTLPPADRPMWLPDGVDWLAFAIQDYAIQERELVEAQARVGNTSGTQIGQTA